MILQPRSIRGMSIRHESLLCAAAGLVLLAATLSGCKNRQKTTEAPETTTTTKIAATSREKLDASYVIGPTPAGELGLRILWQQNIPLAGSSGIKQVDFVDGDLIVADEKNRLTMLRLDDGTQVWHAVPLPPNETIFGIDLIEFLRKKELFISTDTDIFVVDPNTGHLLTRQNMIRIPTTDVVRIGQELIYGCNDGRLVWHHAGVGHEMRANKLNGPIKTTPLIIETDIIATSGNGEVMLLNGRSAQRIWTKQLHAGITAMPDGSPDAIYIAGLDQSLWCLDRNTGGVLWKYFTESPLETSPTVLGDRVFQYIPSEGFICLEALPQGSPRGNVLWKNPDLKGEIVTVLGNDLLVWNEDTHVLMLVDADRGDIKVSTSLPNARHVQVHRVPGYDVVILAYSDDGRIQRLIPVAG